MEMISLNTSLFFSMRTMNGATKSFWNHYVIGNICSITQCFIPLLNSFPACDTVPFYVFVLVSPPQQRSLNLHENGVVIDK